MIHSGANDAAGDNPLLDGSTARTALRLVVCALALLAVLPPLLWAGVGAFGAYERYGATTVAGITDVELRSALWRLLASTALVALSSGAIVLLLWMRVFKQPVQVIVQAEQRLRSFSRRDPLTGLLNRAGLRLALDRAFTRARGKRRKVGVLLIDIDRFRLVNGSLGQPGGDALLRSVAERLRKLVRASDGIARLGGDQFVVLVEGVACVQSLGVMARNILRAFEITNAGGGRGAVTSLSLGVVASGEHADGVDSLLKCAELAMRAAKAAGGGCWRGFEVAMQVDDAQRLEMDRRLREALRGGEFMVAYQPIVSVDDEHVVAVEALLRWVDPTRGTVLPSEFIPVLEQTGLIVQVGHFVLREACRQGRRWMLDGARALVLSVNVSPRQFSESNFVDVVLAVLEETGFPARRLQLEVTEGLLLSPTPETLHKIDVLVDAGVRLAIDDFGIGYSSLAFLKCFRLHTLKIDRLFVCDIPRLERDAAIVRAIVDLGHSLGLKITAEGVETREQCQALRELGCDTLQGFLFSRAVSADELGVMLASSGGASDAQDAVPGWSATMAALLEPAPVSSPARPVAAGRRAPVLPRGATARLTRSDPPSGAIDAALVLQGRESK